MFKPRSFIALSCISLAIAPMTSQPVTAQSTPAEAQLTPAQIKLLQATDMKIVVPAYVPAGFRLRLVQVEADHTARFGMRYAIFYEKYDQSGKTLCFAIESTGGGIGGIPAGSRSFPIDSPVLGKTTLEYGKYGETSIPTLLSDWLGKSPFYRFTGARVLPELSRCDNISPQEAVRVTESLRYLKP